MHLNILFLSLVDYSSLSDGGLYIDLVKNLINDGHDVFVVSPLERRKKCKTHLIKENKCFFLRVKTLNIQKTNIIEKGLSTIFLPNQFYSAIKKYFPKIRFDVIIYPTPPITIYKTVKKIKKNTNAKTYLMLKDIFPQNALDLGLLKVNGLKGILYRYFRKQEIELYKLSDRIGCMSNANIEYLLSNNPYINKNKVELFPNCINPKRIIIDKKTKIGIRQKYNLPINKKIFVYGGNLGKPQNISFMLECIEKTENNPDAFFLIIGGGTDVPKIINYIKAKSPTNLLYLESLPRNEYLHLIGACDVGLIFLDYRFSIPNFPSRFLSYLNMGLPVFACTDLATDIGKVIVDNGLGWWSSSNDSSSFAKLIDLICDDNSDYSENNYNYLCLHHNCEKEFKKVLEVIRNGNE